MRSSETPEGRHYRVPTVHHNAASAVNLINFQKSNCLSYVVPGLILNLRPLWLHFPILWTCKLILLYDKFVHETKCKILVTHKHIERKQKHKVHLKHNQWKTSYSLLL